MNLDPITESPAGFFFMTAPPDRGGTERDGKDGSSGVRRLRVLIVEDEFFISLDTQNLLESLGHEVVGIAVSADEAVRIAERERPDVVLMDIRLVGPRDGIEAADEIRQSYGIGTIFVTANTDPQTQARALATSPLGILAKPLTGFRLRDGLAHIAKRQA